VINVGKELANVALKHPCRSRVVSGGSTSELLKTIHCFVRSFVFAAGIGIVDEQSVKERVELPIDRMMHQTILHRSLMNVAWFGIIDTKSMVRSVLVRFLLQFPMQTDNMICHYCPNKSCSL
jgi:hypothetical protein